MEYNLIDAENQEHERPTETNFITTIWQLLAKMIPATSLSNCVRNFLKSHGINIQFFTIKLHNKISFLF